MALLGEIGEISIDAIKTFKSQVDKDFAEYTVLQKQGLTNLLFHYYKDLNIESLDELKSVCVRNVRFSYKFAIKIFLKFLAHQVFRCIYIFKKKAHSPVIIKSWVDINYSSWVNSENWNEERFSILLLPFLLNPIRQFKFIQMLSSKKINIIFYGYRYSAIALGRFLLRRDLISLYEFESNAVNLAHKDIYLLGAEKLYVMDDVEPLSFIQNSELIKKNITINFRSHGIGRYSPYFSASNTLFFNESQMEYYSLFNTYSSSKCMYPYREKIIELKSIEYVIFVSQITKTASAAYSVMESRIVAKLKAECLKYGILFSIKLHPNTDSSVYSEEKKCSLLTIENSESTLLFSCYSTAYYDFEKYGTNWLIKTKELDPTILFGKQERILDEKNIDLFFDRYKTNVPEGNRLNKSEDKLF